MPDDFEQMWAALAPVGRSAASGGYFRQPFSSAERECHAWFLEQCTARDLRLEHDGNGNTVAWWDVPFETVASQPPQEPSSSVPAVDVSAPTVNLPLGTFVHARSGDKGGDANVGLWVGGERGDLRDRRIGWLLHLVTPDAVRQLLPEAKDLPVEVYPLPNLGGVNVLIRGLLGDGVAASTRFDPQAKAVGEWLRSRHVHIPEELL